MEETKMDKKPLCPYCNAEWTNEMIRVEVEEASGCDSCGQTSRVEIEIKCHKCERVIYRKQGYSSDF